MIRLALQPRAPGAPMVATDADFSAPAGLALAGNPLSPHPPDPGRAANARFAVVWSGTPAETLFDRDPRAWGPAAWSALLGWCARVEPIARDHALRVLLRPHARHVLSDPQRCLHFVREMEGRPFGLSLDPLAMLDEGMERSAEDHIARAMDALAPWSDLLWVGRHPARDILLARAEAFEGPVVLEPEAADAVR